MLVFMASFMAYTWLSCSAISASFALFTLFCYFGERERTGKGEAKEATTKRI